MNSANILKVHHERTFDVKRDVRTQRKVRGQTIVNCDPTIDNRSMKMNIIPAMRRKKLNQTQLAEALDVSKTFVSEMISGKKAPSMETFEKLIEILDVEPNELLLTPRTIPIVGRVGASARVDLIDAYAKGDGLYHIICPHDLEQRKIIGVEVVGDSMEPLISTGDVLLFERHFVGVDQRAINKTAILGTTDGRAMVKLIRPGREKGAFDLYSVNGGAHPPEYGVRLSWATPYRRHMLAQDIVTA